MEEVTLPRPAETPAAHAAPLRFRDYAQILVVAILVALFLRGCIVEAYRIPSESMEHTLRVGDFLLANKFIYGIRTPETVPLIGWKIPHTRLPALRQPQRGDVMVFELPTYANAYRYSPYNYVKRCIGLPGDTVVIVDRRVYVNGELLQPTPTAKMQERSIVPKSYGDSRIFPRGSGFNEDNFGPIVVPARDRVITLTPQNFLAWKDIIRYEGHEIGLTDDGKIMIDERPADSYRVQQDYYFVMGDNRENSLDSRFWGFVPHANVVGKVMLIYWSYEDDGKPTTLLQTFSRIRWERIGRIVE